MRTVGGGGSVKQRGLLDQLGIGRDFFRRLNGGPPLHNRRSTRCGNIL
jgi:hypothetical protein